MHAKVVIPFLIFLILVGLSGYLYSVRSDLVFWGSSKRDGLFFLFFPIIVLPLMLITAFAKRFLIAKFQRGYLKNSFFLYFILIGLPALDTHGSQASLAAGMSICLLVFITVILEYLWTVKTNKVAF